jgi:hypothetical protein
MSRNPRPGMCVPRKGWMMPRLHLLQAPLVLPGGRTGAGVQLRVGRQTTLVAGYSTAMTEQPISPEFLARLLGGEVRHVDGDVQGAFDASGYENDGDDGCPGAQDITEAVKAAEQPT